ncbi:MAG: hypothetical protein LH619_11220 [Chitinophagaceae bacterium]|nr:hypothetical protein [Chitinophagaceae bacterium]
MGRWTRAKNKYTASGERIKLRNWKFRRAVTKNKYTARGERIKLRNWKFRRAVNNQPFGGSVITPDSYRVVSTSKIHN